MLKTMTIEVLLTTIQTKSVTQDEVENGQCLAEFHKVPIA